MILILPLAFISVFVLTRLNLKQCSTRQALLLAAVCFGYYLVLMTEGLTFIRGFTRGNVFGGWLLFSGILFYLAHSKAKEQRTSLFPQFSMKPFKSYFEERIHVVYAALAGCIVAVIAFAAVAIAPNTWDVMMYHLPRVMRWIYNQGVQNYTVGNLWQILGTPGAEFIVAHFQILSGGDRFANTVQFFSLCGSLVAVSLLAKNFGSQARGQWLAVLFTLTLPIGMLQASNAKNGYVMAFWLVCFVYFLMEYQRDNKPYQLYAFAAAVSLSVLTKPIAAFYAMPFLGWFLFSEWKAKGLQMWKPVLIVGAIGIIPLLGHIHRNVELLGWPWEQSWQALAPSVYGNVNEAINPLAFLSNIIRNIVFHVATPFPWLNELFTNFINWAHEVLPYSIMDQRTTFARAGKEFIEIKFYNNELRASSFPHLLLLPVAATLLLVRKDIRQSKLTHYMALVIGSFLVICLLLKMSLSNGRYHVALFILWAPLVGYSLSKVKQQVFVQGLMIFFLITAFYFLLFNTSRPLVGEDSLLKKSRQSQYFHLLPDAEEGYMASHALINQHQCRTTGIMMDEGHWEYPLWIPSDKKGDAETRLEYIHIINVSSKYYDQSFQPECVFVSRSRLMDKLYWKFFGLYKAKSTRAFVSSTDRHLFFVLKD